MPVYSVFRRRAAWLTVLLALVTVTLRAAPAPPVMNAPIVSGAQVLLSWSASPGAVGYGVALGLTPGVPLITQNVGAVTSVQFTSPYSGAAYAWAYAYDASGISAPSNPVVLGIGGATSPPVAPANLVAQVNGNTARLTWSGGSGGGAPLTFVAQVGTAPGASNLGTIPLGLTTSATLPGVPNGTYFVRIYAQNAYGRSPNSNEAVVGVPGGGPGCGAPAASAISASVAGSAVAVAWLPVGGVAGYRLDVSNSPGGAAIASQTYGPATTSAGFNGVAGGTYYIRIYTLSPCGAQTASAETTVTVVAGPRYRTPNPAPGQALALPDMSDVVDAVGRQYPGDLRNSCGNNVFLFRVVQALRQYDTRWGLNWKRARVGDMSQDVVNYNWGPEPDEGTYLTYVVDIIGGHCGGNPSTAFINQTNPTPPRTSNGAIWTLRPYLQAGLPASVEP